MFTKQSPSDYTFHGADLWGTTPLDGFKRVLANSSVHINYAKGCELWSSDQSGFAEAVTAAQNSDVAVVVVGTWSRDQSELWAGLNAVRRRLPCLFYADSFSRLQENTLMLQTLGLLAHNFHSSRQSKRPVNPRS